MVVGCQPYAPAAFTPRNIPGTRGWVDPRAMVWSEGNMSLKNPVTTPGIDPGTVRLVAQGLNHYATPLSWYKNGKLRLDYKVRQCSAKRVYPQEYRTGVTGWFLFRRNSRVKKFPTILLPQLGISAHVAYKEIINRTLKTLPLLHINLYEAGFTAIVKIKGKCLTRVNVRDYQWPIASRTWCAKQI